MIRGTPQSRLQVHSGSITEMRQITQEIPDHGFQFLGSHFLVGLGAEGGESCIGPTGADIISGLRTFILGVKRKVFGRLQFQH
jgi:hypothetical protein